MNSKFKMNSLELKWVAFIRLRCVNLPLFQESPELEIQEGIGFYVGQAMLLVGPLATREIDNIGTRWGCLSCKENYETKRTLDTRHLSGLALS